MRIVGYADTENGCAICPDCVEDDKKDLTPIYDIQEESQAGWSCDVCLERIGDSEDDYRHKDKCELCQRVGVDSNARQERLLVGEYTRSVSLRPVCDCCAENLDADRVTVAECLDCGLEIPYHLLQTSNSFHDMSCEHYSNDNNN